MLAPFVRWAKSCSPPGFLPGGELLVLYRIMPVCEDHIVQFLVPVFNLVSITGCEKIAFRCDLEDAKLRMIAIVLTWVSSAGVKK